MTALGVHFSLRVEQADALWSAYESEDDDAVLAVIGAIETEWDKSHLVQTDKAWDAIHRCLSDGTLDTRGGLWPLTGAVLGGECMYFRDNYIVRFLDRDDVAEVASALATVTLPRFRACFEMLPSHGYIGGTDDNDLEFTWDIFEDLRRFFVRAAVDGRAIAFTADQ